jgi:hypothetical protein
MHRLIKKAAPSGVVRKKAAASDHKEVWPGSNRKASKVTHGFFKSYNAGDPRTFSATSVKSSY